jgi:hypothetical protein
MAMSGVRTEELARAGARRRVPLATGKGAPVLTREARGHPWLMGSAAVLTREAR